MALGLVLDDKTDAFPAGELFGAGLFRIKMVEARLAGKHLAVFGQFQSLAI